MLRSGNLSLSPDERQVKAAFRIWDLNRDILGRQVMPKIYRENKSEATMVFFIHNAQPVPIFLSAKSSLYPVVTTILVKLTERTRRPRLS